SACSGSTTASTRVPEPRRRGRALSGLGLALALAAPAAAELVVLTGGEVLKVSAYEVVGERARLTLAGGGELMLPLLRVERVVDDEVPDEVAPPEPFPPSPFALGFFPGQEFLAPRFAGEIAAAAERHDLNPRLVAAVVGAESAFQARAVSHKGARGLMQLMPATALRFGVAPEELFEPARNLEAGARYLRWLIDRYDGALHLALAAYNAGEGAVDRYRGVPPYRETRRYVLGVYERFGISPGATPR
ncbi:MAG TPA: lytic transglycosylase domain-containing protein, partial [Thermoanaerobaculia bacterium]|nr:lytic transglycosylase domain-containing protein [Thermoanaerobaculia bacterium]